MNRSSRWLCLLLSTTACGDPLLDPQRIERPRLLGARLEVTGDPARAWPAPGEAVTLRWLVAAPEGPVTSSYALAACDLGAGKDNGPLTCASAPFAEVLSAEPSEAAPTWAFVIPADATFERLGVLGSICAFGTTALSGTDVTCTGEGSRALPGTLETRLAAAGDNHNPSLTGAAPTLDGVTWPEAAATSTAGQVCDDVAPRVSAAQSRALIGLAIDATQREPIPVMEVGPTRETLQLSLASTAGEIEQAYVVVSPDDPRDLVPVSLAWSVPRGVPELGLMVRFYFVLRDLRGGVDWLERDVCVVP